MHYICIYVTHPHISMDTATTWKKSPFYFIGYIKFYMIDNLSITILPFARRILKSLSVKEMLLLIYVNWSTNFRGLSHRVKMAPLLSVDEMLLLIYVNWSTNFRGLPHRMEMALFYLRQFILCFICVHAACSRLQFKNSSWAGVFSWRVQKSV